MSEQDPTSSGQDPVVFEAAFRAECEEIFIRRGQVGEAGAGDYPPNNLKGLALSGGGIRSATFCLGVLERLHQAGVLKQFDYLSTVSGGGFVGGWWSAWLARPKRKRPARGESDIFPGEEGIEPERTHWSLSPASQTKVKGQATDQPEGSMCAGVDPIHHLRLFANYLTPRKGALSGDTWRAATVVTRNLFLTVLMLLPVLGAAVLGAQLYFVSDASLVIPFVCADRPSRASPDTVPSNRREARPAPAREGTACSKITEGTVAAGTGSTATGNLVEPAAQYSRELRRRAARFLAPVLILLAWTLLAVAIWMWFATGKMIVALGAFLSVLMMVWLVRRQIAPSTPSLLQSEFAAGKWFLPVLGLGALGIGLYAFYLLLDRWRKRRQANKDDRPAPGNEVLTNRITRLQSALLVALTLVTVVLLVGGFGHEVVRYVFSETRGGWIGRYVARVGGWATILLTLAGAVFTALKTAPTGGADRQTEQPTGFKTLVFAATPFLVLVVLMLALATASHALLGTLRVSGPGQGPSLHVALLLGVAICFFFAIYEFWSDAGEDRAHRGAMMLAAVIGGVLAFLIPPLQFERWIAGAIVGICLGLTLVLWVLPRIRPNKPQEDGLSNGDRVGKSQPMLGRVVRIMLLIAGPLVAAGLLGTIAMSGDASGHENPLVTNLALAGIVFVGVFLFVSLLSSREVNHRVLGLQTLVVILLSVLYMEQFLAYGAPEVAFPMAVFALIGVALSGVVGLGWMIDPNYLSLHTFYRARLVRAYLGASNYQRMNAEITESAEGDDLSLHELMNCQRGGPYHLINTTLNLVAGRDLATSQRSAACFTLSKRHCGSLRTGYRDTTHYMDGKFKLGTALAVSGAAASPNMGSKTSSAALAMLLALLNVRLGFWAPNPAKSRWTSPRPRLWPFYLLREFLSQTNDLSPYCYLTDGGHFDNTGLYSLVQRGCRQIVMVDCGADPTPCFADLGDAIRRCRIDFGVDIDLAVKEFQRNGERLSSTHFVTGTIVYHPEHARRLGWSDPGDKDRRRGTIVWIKPSLVKGDPADVLQYSLENGTFPQQTTADQWFDEAQFESYRRLGWASAGVTLADAKVREAFAEHPTH